MNSRTVLFVLLLGSFPLLGQSKTSTVMGLVRDANGKPAANIRVLLSIPIAGAPASLPTLGVRNLFQSFTATPVRTTETDVDGAFYFTDVTTGRYILAADGPAGWTYFPHAVDRTTASPVMVNSLPTNDAGTITLLAPGTPGINVPPDRPDSDGLKKVPVRINVEGGLPPRPNPFELFFAGDNQAVTVRFVARTGKLPPPTLEFTYRSPRSLYVLMPSPADFSGVFEVPIWAGEFSVLPTGHPGKNGFYIKAVSMGSTDLRKQRLKLVDSLKDPIVVILAACTATTPECN